MLKDCPIHVNIPFQNLSQYIDSFLKHHLNIELHINSGDIDNTPYENFKKWGSIFRNNGLELTLHAPFIDLSPGAIDSKIRRASLERMFQFLDIAQMLNPKMIIVHPGFDHWRYSKAINQWVKNSHIFWKEILNYSEGSRFTFAIENVFEQTPATLQELIELIASTRFGFCFDTGHFNLFSKKPLEEWFTRLGSYLFETHLHDNKGDEDSHSPLGEGTFSFDLYFELLSNLPKYPILTFETHSEEGIMASLKFFNNHYINTTNCKTAFHT